MTDLADGDARALVFEGERSRLRSIAYRMLTVADDADDVVQEAWFRFATAGDLENPAAWLTTVVTRLSIDELRSARRQRERYVGPWLAEPMFDTSSAELEPGNQVVLLESISLGFLAVMERLSPLERAVFILHDVFAIPLAEVASIVERGDAATRQLAKRARDHIAGERARFEPDPSDVETLTRQVMEAALTGDLETLGSLLAEDVVHVSDGGAHRRAARRPVVGRDRVARFFVNLAQRSESGVEFHTVRANGQFAVYSTSDGGPLMLQVANWVDGQIVGSYSVLNPDKLAAFHRAWLAAR